MATALLLVIYLSYISLGLPDTLLGAAWPAMREGLHAPLEMAGPVSLTVSLATVASSLLSGRLLRRLGAGGVAFVSVLFTALGLLGFSLAKSLPWLLLTSIPLGLGAGAVDAGLNNFVALHYRPMHMNFLHCFWGLGAMGGPAVMSFWISRGSWPLGYRSVAVLQLLLALVLGLSLPLWRNMERRAAGSGEEPPQLLTCREALGLPGVKTSLLAFFCYCSLELAAGLWASSYLVERRGVPAQQAALCSSLFYGGMAAGRFLAGLLSQRLSSRALIRAGQGFCAAGALLLLCPLPLPAAVAGLGLFGLGCAPLYPSMLQETPARFGRRASQSVMGLQMAAAYFGSTAMPPLLGFLAQRLSLRVFPWFLLLGLGLMALFCERLNRSLSRKNGESG